MKNCHKEAMCPSLDPHYLQHWRKVTFTVYFIFHAYPALLLFFSHLPTQSSRITADTRICSSFSLPFLSTLPTGWSSHMFLLTPTITPSVNSAYCNAVPVLQRNVRCLPPTRTVHRLLPPPPPRPKITTTISNVQLFFFPKIKSQWCRTYISQCTGNIPPSGSSRTPGSAGRPNSTLSIRASFWKVCLAESLCRALTCIERIADSAEQTTESNALGAS